MYDGFGNRTSVKVTENGKETKSVIATFNEGNQLLKFGNESLTYDANGNRTSDGKYTYMERSRPTCCCNEKGKANRSQHINTTTKTVVLKKRKRTSNPLLLRW